MNQIPTNRPPRPKYQGRPIRLPKKCAPPKALVLATTLTAILLVVSIMTLSIALLVGTPNEFESGSGGKKKEKTEEIQEAEPPISAKFLTFPSKTASGSYLSTNAANVVTGDSRLKSKAAILVDMNSTTALFAQSADTKVYPASMTKVMTLLVACEEAKDPTELLTITPEMMEALNTQKTTTVQINGFWTSKGASTWGGWSAGDQITLEDALFLVNYRSDTIACWLLANRFGGGEQGFVAKMNQKARSMGLTGTKFSNCTGLYNEDHYTTCREMAAIMQAAMNNPAAKTVIMAYTEHVMDVYRDGVFNRTIDQIYAAWYSERLSNNAWVGNGSDLKFRGGKTGWEEVPKACFVTVAQNTEKTDEWYICVTVGRITTADAEVSASECTKDAKYLYRRYAEGNASATW